MAKEFNTHKVIVIAQSVLNELYKLGLPGVDAVTLYNFYYYTANWQTTRQTKATGGYCRKGLHWGKERFFIAKKILVEKKLIIEVQKSKKGLFSEVYIQLPYKAKEATAAVLVEGLRTAVLPDRPAVYKDTNTTSVNNINATSVNKLEEEEDRKRILNTIGTEGRGNGEATTLISPIPTTVPPLPPIAPAPLSSHATALAEIVNLANTEWDEYPKERITPVTEENIRKRLNEGYTSEDFKKAIEHSCEWSAGVPRNLTTLVRTKSKFNEFVNWQDRTKELSAVHREKKHWK